MSRGPYLIPFCTNNFPTKDHKKTVSDVGLQVNAIDSQAKTTIFPAVHLLLLFSSSSSSVIILIITVYFYLHLPKTSAPFRSPHRPTYYEIRTAALGIVVSYWSVAQRKRRGLLVPLDRYWPASKEPRTYPILRILVSVTVLCSWVGYNCIRPRSTSCLDELSALGVFQRAPALFVCAHVLTPCASLVLVLDKIVVIVIGFCLCTVLLFV